MVTQERKPPKLGPKKNSSASNATPKVTPQPSNAGLRKASNAATRPSASPAQSSNDVPRKKPPKLPSRQGSEATIASQKPSVTPRRASNFSGTTASVEQNRKPPKLQEKQSSLAPPDSSQTRKPSIAARRPSNLNRTTTGADQKRKPPKLGPKKTSDGASAKPQGQKPLTKPKPKQTPDVTKDTTAHKVDEEQQDLKSILSGEQCEGLVQLTASITNRMRRTIEDNFNATATLKFGDDDKDEDKFASLDYDPGTVDVAAYDKEKKLREERQKELSTPKVKELKTASLKWFDEWRAGFLKRVDETVNPGNTTSLQRAQKEGTGKTSLAGQRPVQIMSADANAKEAEKTSPKLEQLFPRVATSLTKMEIARRELVLHSFLLLLLSLEHYNAASRVFLLYLASSLKLGLKALREDEEQTAKGLLEAAKQISASKETLAKGKESEESRRWKMRLATVAGAAIVGLSGGFAAPMIAASVGAMMGEMGLGASAAAGYLGAVAGNTYLVGSLFGAYGGRMTGEMMRNLSADVNDFAFLPVHGERKEHEDSIDAVTDTRRLRVVIAITGWLLEKEEVVTPWKVLKPSAEIFALRFELETLMSLGQSINTMSANSAYEYAQTAFNQRSMVTDLTSVIWPLALVKIARVVENPFNLAKARADKAGKVLADALINHTQGERPVTLIGYSSGARVIYSCLTSLAERRAFGLVESVVMLGAPVPSDIGTWRSMRTAISGRLVNVYSKNDYLLAFLYRTSSLQYGVAGLMPISGLSGVENFDVSETVSSHLRYRYLVGSILQKIGFEDIDKDEVAKEAEAFKTMTAEDNRHDYIGEVKESAGEIYKQYAKGGKQPPPRKISDKEADRQVSAMEKEVQQKTQTGLMQWAVEQLYLSGPSAPSAEDVEKAKSDPKGAIKDANKSVNKTADTATKSMYQRAVDAVYISRSGGPEGEDAAKGKIADAKGTADSAASSSYLMTAAGYIPTSYIPGFGAAGSISNDTKKKAVQTSEQVGAAKDKGTEAGKPSEEVKKKVEAAPESPGNTVKPAPKKTKSTKPQKRSDVATKEPAETATDPKESAGDSPTKEDLSSTTDTKEPAGNASQATGEAPSDAQKETGKEATAGGGYGSFIPSFGFGSSSKKSIPAAAEKASDASNAAKPATEGTGPTSGDGNASTGEDQSKGDSTHTTPTKAKEAMKISSPKEKEKFSGYGSYIPSFGFGGRKSKENPKVSAEAAGDAKKDDNGEAKGETDEKSKDAGDAAKPESKDTSDDTDTEPRKYAENESKIGTDETNKDAETEFKGDIKEDNETESATKENDDTNQDSKSEVDKDNANGDLGDTDDEQKPSEDPFVK